MSEISSHGPFDNESVKVFVSLPLYGHYHLRVLLNRVSNE